MNVKIPSALLFCAIAIAAVTHTQYQAFAKTAEKTDNVCAPDPGPKFLIDEKINKLGFEDLKVLADKGNADALVALGIKYMPAPNNADTNNSPPPDMDKAAALFRAAADKGNGAGEYFVGATYKNGMGAPHDDVKALGWFRRAARHGVPNAKLWIGLMTKDGAAGLKADEKAAVTYLKEAARGGASDAYVELGVMYTNGQGGLKVDYQKAAFCYRQALPYSYFAGFNLRRLIEMGRVERQPGDPSESILKPAEQPTGK